jgi:PAS domain S-box-containing protein
MVEKNRLMLMVDSISKSSTGVLADLTSEAAMKVLLVDGDLNHLKVAEQCLKMQGRFRVDNARSAEEAMEKMKKETYDAIISDCEMPGKNGLGFLKELREKGNDTPFIIFTGRSREEVAIKALNLGADGYFNRHGEPETVYGELAHGIRQAVERKKAYMKMWEREERLRAVFGSSPDAITVSDLHGNILDCSEAAWKMLGFSSKEEVIGKSSFDFIAKKDRQKAYESLKKTLEQGTVRNLEYTLLNKDGEEFWGELSASILKDSLGNPLGFVGIMRDITTRKKAERTLSKAMGQSNAFRKSGIEVVGSFPWGTHLCQFYKTKDDLLETLVPYFAEGLRNNEYCMWVTSEPLGTEEAKEAMRKAVPGFDRCLERGQIEMLPHTEWYLKDGAFNRKRVLDGWINKLNEALAKGYDGLRLTGNTFWLEKEDWNDFANYEKAVNSVIEQYKMIAICTYSLDKCQASEVIDVVSNHQFALIRKSGEWKIVESSEFKNAREEARRSSEILRDVFACSPDAMMIFDLDGNIVDCNEAALGLMGYSSKEEIVGKNRLEYIAEKDRESALKSLKIAFEQGTTKNVEHTFLKKNGEEYQGELSTSILRDSVGNPTCFVSVIRDTSERKKAEEELRDSEERLSILFELAPDAYYLNDLKGNFIDGNKAAEKLTGYMKDELVGKSFLKLKLLPRNEVLKAAKLLAMNAFGKSTGPDEFVLNRKGGTQVPVEIRTYPVKIKGKTVVLGIARDISVRKKDEQAVKESQRKFEGLFRHNPEAMVYLDSDFRILDANPRFYQLFGYSARKVEGKSINEVVAPEDMMEEAERLDKDAKNGYANRDTVRKRKDGSLVQVSISAAPVTIEDRPLGYVGVYKDITNLKDAEEHLREANERLEVTNEKLHVVGGLTRHDVRNKLTAVAGNAYLLRQKLVGDAKALGQLNDMEAAIRLVEEIFEFARNYEKLGVERLTSMDVGKAVDEAVSLFCDLKGVKIVNECRGLTVLADSLLSQLFYNLIDNSLKYGKKTQQIRLYYKTSSTNQLELVYEDDGVGIPDNMRSSLFKEGFTSGKGTGYGLFMIRRICEVYGWSIQETGIQGKGVKFVIAMPKTNPNGKENYRIV